MCDIPCSQTNTDYIPAIRHRHGRGAVSTAKLEGQHLGHSAAGSKRHQLDQDQALPEA